MTSRLGGPRCASCPWPAPSFSLTASTLLLPNPFFFPIPITSCTLTSWSRHFIVAETTGKTFLEMEQDALDVFFFVVHHPSSSVCFIILSGRPRNRWRHNLILQYSTGTIVRITTVFSGEGKKLPLNTGNTARAIFWFERNNFLSNSA